MNKKRLLKLADLLEADAKNKRGVRFTLGVWAAPHNGSAFMTAEEKALLSVSCNTAACAMGLAALSGAFKRAGLTYVFSRWGAHQQQMVPSVTGKDGNEHRGFDAAAYLFGIESYEAEWLFSASHYDGVTNGARGERKVANRIRDFVEGTASPYSE